MAGPRILPLSLLSERARAVGVGDQLGNYRLIRLLGEGGFASVYLGEHVHLGTQAAIKTLHGRTDQNTFNTFLAEAQMLARLDHPYIVRVLDFGKEGDLAYLVMTYAPNGTLRTRHTGGTRLPVETILAYIEQVASALQYAHDEGFIHRDVKPDNLLIGRHQEVLLSDFGIAVIAQSLAAPENGSQVIAGTPAYMAPEQAEGKPSKASDQYALAIAAYEWLSGSRPFEGSVFEILGKKMASEPPPLRDKVPDLSPAVEAVIMKALARDPAARFPSVRAFVEALKQACQPSPSLPSEPSSPPPPPADGLVNQRFGNYRLLRMIGEGNFAYVYQGEHVELQTYAAVKIMKTQLTQKETEKFREEARILLHLKHDHIVRFFDFGVTGGTPYLVTEYAPQGSLYQEEEDQREPVPLETVVGYVRQIAQALRYIHEQRLIHRDLKPTNLLVAADGSILLTDFGLATIMQSTRSQRTEDMAGTYAYMAPEQIQGKPRPASDQYALGIMVYEFLTGKRPFDGTMGEIIGQHLVAEPEPLRDKVPTIPAAVEQVVLKALAKNPKDRFESVMGFAEAFEQAATTSLS